MTVEIAGLTLLDANPLAPGGSGAADLFSASGTPVIWSGTLAQELFSLHPANWGPGAWSALHGWCDGVRSDLERAGKRVLLRPHARHVLSDVQRCVRFFDERAGQPFGMALEPSAFFEPSMLGDADDHLTRILTFLGPRASVLIVSDAAPGSEDDDPVSRPPLSEGGLNRALFRSLVDAHVPPGTPTID